MQPVKFKYNSKHVIFFVLYKGTEVEVMRSGLVGTVEDLIRLRKIAQSRANDLLSVLKRAA